MAEFRSPSIAPESDPLSEVIGHLGAILMQSVPSDDRTIIEHVHAAHQIALDLYRETERSRVHD